MNNLLFDFTVDKAAKTVNITREFDANLSLVWDAFTKAEILDQWVAPKPFTSKTKVSGSKKCARLIEARLQAVLSKNMYSLHGLEALISPPSGQVCHSLIVVLYCVPGSAQRQAA